MCQDKYEEPCRQQRRHPKKATAKIYTISWKTQKKLSARIFVYIQKILSHPYNRKKVLYFEFAISSKPSVVEFTCLKKRSRLKLWPKQIPNTHRFQSIWISNLQIYKQEKSGKSNFLYYNLTKKAKVLEISGQVFSK